MSLSSVLQTFFSRSACPQFIRGKETKQKSANSIKIFHLGQQLEASDRRCHCLSHCITLLVVGACSSGADNSQSGAVQAASMEPQLGCCMV